MSVFYVVVGVLGVACGVAQYLSAVGRLDLSAWPWPFVTGESRAVQKASAVAFTTMGIALIALGVFA